MKTLIFNGSPRKHGETQKLIDCLKEELGGEIKVVDTYYVKVRPCMDCRYCMDHEGCAIDDEMQVIYQDIADADHIIIASPIYYEELTGMLLAVLSRLQIYFGAIHVRHKHLVTKPKTGGILLVGGSIGPREKAESTAMMLLEQMLCKHIGTVYMGWTDRKLVEDRPEILEEVRELARALKEQEVSEETTLEEEVSETEASEESAEEASEAEVTETEASEEEMPEEETSEEVAAEEE